jgi:hypothetical protein
MPAQSNSPRALLWRRPRGAFKSMASMTVNPMYLVEISPACLG